MVENKYLQGEEEKEQKTPIQKKNRMLKVEVTDGVNTFWLLEYTPFDEQMPVVTGSKYILKPS